MAENTHDLIAAGDVKRERLELIRARLRTGYRGHITGQSLESEYHFAYEDLGWLLSLVTLETDSKSPKDPKSVGVDMKTITFSVEPIDASEDRTDDPGVTCIFCGLYKCTQVIAVLGDGRRIWCGMHERCGERHTKRLREILDRE